MKKNDFEIQKYDYSVYFKTKSISLNAKTKNKKHANLIRDLGLKLRQMILLNAVKLNAYSFFRLIGFYSLIEEIV